MKKSTKEIREKIFNEINSRCEGIIKKKNVKVRNNKKENIVNIEIILAKNAKYDTLNLLRCIEIGGKYHYNNIGYMTSINLYIGSQILTNFINDIVYEMIDAIPNINFSYDVNDDSAIELNIAGKFETEKDLIKEKLDILIDYSLSSRLDSDFDDYYFNRIKELIIKLKTFTKFR